MGTPHYPLALVYRWYFNDIEVAVPRFFCHQYSARHFFVWGGGKEGGVKNGYLRHGTRRCRTRTLATAVERCAIFFFCPAKGSFA